MESHEGDLQLIRERIKTLPSKADRWKGHSDMPFYLYQGFWYKPFVLENIMWQQDHFVAHPSDIVLATPHKGGTTWLNALAFAIVTRDRFNSSTSPLLTSLSHDCVRNLALPSLREVPKTPLLGAFHTPYVSLPKSILASGCKIVYMCREPKDLFVSQWYFLQSLSKEQVSLEEAIALFCEDASPFGTYWDHVLGYWKASLQRPNEVLFLKYEDMKRSTMDQVKKLAEFMGYPFSPEEETEGKVKNVVDFCSFDNLRNLEVNKTGFVEVTEELKVSNNLFYRRGEVGDWENHLTREMQERIDRITEERFTSWGLTYDIAT
ncbi:Sulfotransferase domain [Dillenia turbinata]|uniref:Sulfotransferase n=1 Tax=Dillenia turbinata TaxID=194707 RepID=A0AAN8V7V4_9MAGN